MMRLCFLIFLFLMVVPSTIITSAHEPAKAQYIANEGVMVTAGDRKIMFDPLPLSGFGVYMDVPDQVRGDMMAGLPPYDDIDVVFVSHAHRDHFSASEMTAYMHSNPETHIVVPQQALDMMKKDTMWDRALRSRVTSLNMQAGDQPVRRVIGDVAFTAVRIPHSGWPAPARAAVQNMVYRVTLGGTPDTNITVMHMGDADVNVNHYTPHKAHWEAKRTDTAFPPYWFLPSQQGRDIIYTHMNTEAAIGTHVPLRVPKELIQSGADYFSKSGETREITPSAAPSYGCRKVVFEAQNYTVCTYNQDHDLRLFWGEGKQPYGNFSVVNEALASESKRLVFAMNAGMYHQDFTPVGLYIEGGVTRQTLSTRDGPGNFHMKPNGVFWIGQTGGFNLSTTDDFKKRAKTDEIKYATQSGPMLVINGKRHPRFLQNSESLKRRNGVGVTRDGKSVIFAISDELVNFYNFAGLFKEYLDIPQALYFDGTISRLYDPANKRIDPGMPMGPIIGVVEPITPQ